MILFCFRSPSAIGRFVIPVVFDAVNGMIFRRSFAHIGKEVFKTMKPSFTDSYTTSTVIFPAYCIRIQTSFPHVDPDGIFCRTRHSMRPTNRNLSLSARHTSRAPSGCEPRRINNSFRATFTLAKISGRYLITWNFFDNNKFPKFPSGKIYFFGMPTTERLLIYKIPSRDVFYCTATTTALPKFASPLIFLRTDSNYSPLSKN